RHTRFSRDWSSDVCSADLEGPLMATIPELVGGTEDAARQALDGVEGLHLGRILPVNDAGSERGTVLRAEVNGDEIEAGEEVLQRSEARRAGREARPRRAR